jgi:arginyl-tRNA synthetase
MYGTTDLATIVDRVQTFDPALVVYVVDQRQHLHFEQVFRAARQAGIAGHAALEHIGFGTMNGMDGKPFRTRDGGVLRLKDLIAMMHDAAADRLREHGLATSYAEDERDDIAEKVGLAALKFADLCNYPAANYVFDLERFTRFEGRTGPYLLYALVRITSLLRKAEEQDDRPGTIAPPDHDSARDLMLALGRFPDAFQAALAERAPNKIADYAFDCAQAFSRFYAACHILSEPDARLRAARLALASFTGTVLERCLALLGIEAPARM